MSREPRKNMPLKMSEKIKPGSSSQRRSLHLQDASVVKGGRRILDGLSLKIRLGEHTAVLEPQRRRKILSSSGSSPGRIIPGA